MIYDKKKNLQNRRIHLPLTYCQTRPLCGNNEIDLSINMKLLLNSSDK